MPSARRSLATAVADFFAVDDDWERPTQPVTRTDWAIGITLAVAGVLLLEMIRSVTRIDDGDLPRWVQWAATASGGLLVVFRRRRPVVVGVLAAAHMFVVGVTMPMVMGQISLQVVYFTAIYAAVAYARQRRSALLIVAAITVFMLLWIGWQFALGSGVDEITRTASDQGGKGWFSPVLAAVIATILINIVYFVGAIVVGQIAWRGARQRARLEEQAATITAQAESLQRRAVVDERLRIARELHDVVGHHVAVIGIQAAAARRVLDKRPDDAAIALTQIETSSRDAVTQMRSLLGTLRDIEASNAEAEAAARPGGATTDGAASSRSPEPGLADLPGLVAEHDRDGLRTAYEVVETRPGAHGDIAGPIGLSLYRIVQEALANVTRHSSASRADVVLRVVEEGPARAYAEVEVVDDGRTRPGTSGSGLGQLGMRERAASHHGTVDIGPRPLGGYRVRVRVPLGENDV